MASSIPSFLFGAGTKYKTQEELDRAREQVKALLEDTTQYKGWGGVLENIGEGIAAGLEQRRIGEGQEGLSAEQAKLWERFGGGGYSGADPDAIVATSGADTAAGSVGTDPVNQSFTRPPPSSGGGGGDYLSYANKGATRNLPLAPKLVDALSFLGDMGITARVVSGGQPSAAEVAAARARGIKLGRTGSVRHDHGNAADVDLYQGNRKLSWRNKGDIPILQQIVQEGKRRGITGWGAGEGYMGGNGRIHLGFGTPAVWGAGGEGANAAGWLTDAYSGRLVGGAGASGQAGGAGTDPIDQAFTSPPPSSTTPPVPVPVAARNVPVNDAGLRTPAGADFLSRMGNPAPMGGQPLPMVPTMTGPMPPPQPPQPAPAPPPAPAPVPPAPPAPPPQVDPFTDMILGDKAAQFKPGNYIPPAPVGKQVFPAAPPAPGTPAAAGFGVPPVVGGGGADQLAGKGRPRNTLAGGEGKIANLMFVLASPYASDEQKRMATAMLSREYALEDERRKAASPEAQLDMEYKRAQIAALGAKDNVDDVVVVGKRLYNKKTKEWIDPPAGGDEGGLFDSTSVEGQALNGMVKTGKITVEQAYDLATGKTVTDPETGEIIFKSGTQLISQFPGQPPQPVQPDATAPATTTPSATTPATPPRTGTVLTGKKPAAPPSDTERRAQALVTVASPELKIVEKMFPALGNIDDQLLSKMPWNSSNWATSENYQRGKNALQSLITSYMFVVSGSDTPPAQVALIAEGLMPQPGEKPASVRDKLARVRNYVEAMKQAAGRAAEETAPAAGGGGNIDYNSIYGLPLVPK